MVDLRSDGNPVQNLFFGVVVGDDWLSAMHDGDAEKRRLWARVLQRRSEVGMPYVLFEGNANRGAPDVYRDQGLRVRSSNLCTEIMLPVVEDESFACDLSSMNLRHYEAWKDTDAVEVLTCFLDAVMSEFIEPSAAIPHLARAHRFARRHRSLGVGVLGWHSYLQEQRIPFGSLAASAKNREIFRTVRDAAQDASAQLARRYGEPELLSGYGRRNATLTAVAPTTSSTTAASSTSTGSATTRRRCSRPSARSASSTSSSRPANARSSSTRGSRST